MRSIVVAFLALLLAALAAAPPAAAQGTAGGDVRDDSPVLPSERVLNELEEAELRRLLQGFGVDDASETATGLRRIVKVELIRAVPRKGNNPFNVNDPINNNTINGVVRQVAVDDDGNNNLGGGLDDCIGQSVNGAPSGGAPPDFRFISIRIDPITLDCQVAAGDSADGDFLIFEFRPDDGFNQSSLAIFPDRTVPIWVRVNPAVDTFISPFNAGQTLIQELLANNGKQVQAIFTVSPVGANNFNLTIINMVQTN